MQQLSEKEQLREQQEQAKREWIQQTAQRVHDNFLKRRAMQHSLKSSTQRDGSKMKLQVCSSSICKTNWRLFCILLDVTLKERA
jgi:hypothetical protein